MCSIWSQSLANVADIPTLRGQFQEDVGSTVGADCTTTGLCDLGKPLTLSVPPKLQFHQHSRVRFCAVGLYIYPEHLLSTRWEPGSHTRSHAHCVIPVASDLTVWRVFVQEQVTAWAEVKGELAGRLGESGREPAKGKRKGSAFTAVTTETLRDDLCLVWGYVKATRGCATQAFSPILDP